MSTSQQERTGGPAHTFCHAPCFENGEKNLCLPLSHQTVTLCYSSASKLIQAGQGTGLITQQFHSWV